MNNVYDLKKRYDSIIIYILYDVVLISYTNLSPEANHRHSALWSSVLPLHTAMFMILK